MNDDQADGASGGGRPPRSARKPAGSSGNYKRDDKPGRPFKKRDFKPDGGVAGGKRTEAGDNREQGAYGKKNNNRSDRFGGTSKTGADFVRKPRPRFDREAGAPAEGAHGHEESRERERKPRPIKPATGPRANQAKDTRPFRERNKPAFDKTSVPPKSTEPTEEGSFQKKMDKAFRERDKNDPKKVVVKVERQKFEDKVYGELQDPDTRDRLKKTYRKPGKPVATGAGRRDAASPAGRAKTAPVDPEKEMPLNKYIAHSGECSRRDAAEFVKQGKVKVNGELVIDPGYKVQPDDKVTMGGKKLTPSKGFVYLLLNKPKGFITTNDDPQGRRTVMELVASAGLGRLYPVGRLDRDTTGLILLTNDGDLTQKLSHPSFEIKKVYHVTLDKPLTKADFDKVFEGVELEDGKAPVDALAFLEKKNELGLEIHSGKNRIVRRIFESLGYVVEKLDRVMYAGLTKKNLPRSKWRFLDEREVVLLKHFKS